jgi:hypothetical protein
MKKSIWVAKLKAAGFVAAVSTLTAVGNASAALTWGDGGIALDLTDVDSAMGLIAVGLATLWGYRKIIKTLNKS